MQTFKTQNTEAMAMRMIYFDNYEPPEPVTLCGGFHTALTQSERNAWKEYISPNETWIAYCAETWNFHAIACAIKGGAINREQEYRDSGQRLDDLNGKLYQIGKQWYAELIAKNKATAEA
jgi:hypothetical protein